MHRSKAIAVLVNHLLTRTIPSLAVREQSIIDVLNAKNCLVTVGAADLTVRFTPGTLFDALWSFASEELGFQGESSNWTDDVKELAAQLMNPWPDKELLAMGAEVKLEKPGKWRQVHLYEYKLRVESRKLQ